jgi:hypothetical protein
MDELQSERLKHFPNVNSLLKISLGLVLFTVISSALVYAETLSVDIEGNSFDVDYTANQVVVNSIIAQYEPSIPEALLIINVEVTGSSGTLDFVFDRSFFDSTFDGVDDPFFVLADGLEATFTETATTQSRTLSIQVPTGTEDLEIIGTFFGDSSSISTEDFDSDAKAAADKAVADKAVADKAVADAKASQTQCGSGTIIQNGVCVLDERCGPGTVLEDGACVLDSTPKSSETSVKIDSRELIAGTVTALVIALIIIIILGIMSKASKSKN